MLLAAFVFLLLAKHSLCKGYAYATVGRGWDNPALASLVGSAEI